MSEIVNVLALAPAVGLLVAIVVFLCLMAVASARRIVARRERGRAQDFRPVSLDLERALSARETREDWQWPTG